MPSGFIATVQHSTGPASMLLSSEPRTSQILMWLSRALEAITAPRRVSSATAGVGASRGRSRSITVSGSGERDRDDPELMPRQVLLVHELGAVA